MENNNENGFEIGIGNKHFKAWGFQTILVIGITAIIASTVWSGYQIQKVMLDGFIVQKQESLLRKQEHAEIKAGNDRTSCVLSMTVEQRTRFRESYRSGSWVLWCPWMYESIDNRGSSN